MKKWFFVLLSSVLFVTGFVAPAFAQGDVDCGDFNGDGRAVAKFWVENGFSATNDPHRLDGDGDGLPCEASQADIDYYRNAGGATLPNTASNHVAMVVLGGGIAAAGILMSLRRKKGME